MTGNEFLLAVLLLWLVPAVVLIIMMKACARLYGDKYCEDEVIKALVPVLNIVTLVVSITGPLTEWLTKWINKDANVLN